MKSRLLHVMLYRAFRRETNEIASFCMLFVVGKTLRAPAVPCCGLPEVKRLFSGHSRRHPQRNNIRIANDGCRNHRSEVSVGFNSFRDPRG